MSETVKPTPGPWVIETETKGYEVCTIHQVERQPTEEGLGQSWVYVRPAILFFDGEWHWPNEAEQLANARLIAAAPDLLEMLKVAQLWLEVDGRYDMQGINAAIAKAEGHNG